MRKALFLSLALFATAGATVLSAPRAEAATCGWVCDCSVWICTCPNGWCGHPPAWECPQVICE